MQLHLCHSEGQLDGTDLQGRLPALDLSGEAGAQLLAAGAERDPGAGGPAARGEGRDQADPLQGQEQQGRQEPETEVQGARSDTRPRRLRTPQVQGRTGEGEGRYHQRNFPAESFGCSKKLEDCATGI